MNEIEAERVVHDLLLGPDSLPMQVHRGDFVNESNVDELFDALSVLIDFYRDLSSVPKALALALIDISAIR